jgi:hypothetical protein
VFFEKMSKLLFCSKTRFPKFFACGGLALRAGLNVGESLADAGESLRRKSQAKVLMSKANL